MTKTTRRRIDAGLKARIALEALREQATVADLARQCALLGVARSGVCRPRRPGQRQRRCADAPDRPIVHRLALLGPRRMTAMLRGEGESVNRKRVQRLMRLMGIAALEPKPRTSKPAPGHKRSPPTKKPPQTLPLRGSTSPRQARRRCWEQAWVVEFDIRGLFDNLDHGLLTGSAQALSGPLDPALRRALAERRCKARRGSFRRATRARRKVASCHRPSWSRDCPVRAFGPAKPFVLVKAGGWEWR